MYKKFSWRRLLIVAPLVMWGTAVFSRASVIQGFDLPSVGTVVSTGRHESVGFTFQTTQPLSVAALGTLEAEGGSSDALTAGHPLRVKLYTFALNAHGQARRQSLVAQAVIYSSDPIYSLSGQTESSGAAGFRYDFDLTDKHGRTLSSLTLPAGHYELMAATFGANVIESSAASSQVVGLSGPAASRLLHADSHAGWSSHGLAGINGLFGPNLLLEAPTTSTTPSAVGSQDQSQAVDPPVVSEDSVPEPALGVGVSAAGLALLCRRRGRVPSRSER